ncbi:hypothetical protein B0T14DRAFT_28854 [Immersiella caudata]|uniref:Uncharacterized protein n=1 Tax=Immersiella caudata TaxID=314043 RepID=A0AA39XFN4_9PEZI|nr:hypothetical protein B0T14DRAFT_28854 [Immersiella caudata]
MRRVSLCLAGMALGFPMQLRPWDMPPVVHIAIIRFRRDVRRSPQSHCTPRTSAYQYFLHSPCRNLSPSRNLVIQALPPTSSSVSWPTTQLQSVLRAQTNVIASFVMPISPSAFPCKTPCTCFSACVGIPIFKAPIQLHVRGKTAPNQGGLPLGKAIQTPSQTMC